jgi:hypothetical protein
MLMETVMTLAATEAECAQGRQAPRVSLADIEANIHAQVYLTGFDAVKAATRRTSLGTEVDYEHFARKAVGNSVDTLTICLLVLKNGFTVIGHSAPADPANFEETLGRELAYENAVRQVWPLMGYALKEKLNA